MTSCHRIKRNISEQLPLACPIWSVILCAMSTSPLIESPMPLQEPATVAAPATWVSVPFAPRLELNSQTLQLRRVISLFGSTERIVLPWPDIFDQWYVTAAKQRIRYLDIIGNVLIAPLDRAVAMYVTDVDLPPGKAPPDSFLSSLRVVGKAAHRAANLDAAQAARARKITERAVAVAVTYSEQLSYIRLQAPCPYRARTPLTLDEKRHAQFVLLEHPRAPFDALMDAAGTSYVVLQSLWSKLFTGPRPRASQHAVSLQDPCYALTPMGIKVAVAYRERFDVHPAAVNTPAGLLMSKESLESRLGPAAVGSKPETPLATDIKSRLRKDDTPPVPTPAPAVVAPSRVPNRPTRKVAAPPATATATAASAKAAYDENLSGLAATPFHALGLEKSSGYYVTDPHRVRYASYCLTRTPNPSYPLDVRTQVVSCAISEVAVALSGMVECVKSLDFSSLPTDLSKLTMDEVATLLKSIAALAPTLAALSRLHFVCDNAHFAAALAANVDMSAHDVAMATRGHFKD